MAGWDSLLRNKPTDEQLPPRHVVSPPKMPPVIHRFSPRFKNGKPRFQRPTSTPPCPVPESTGNKRRPSSPNLPKEAAPAKRRREPPKKDLPKGDLPKGKEPSPDRGHNAKRQQGGQEPPPRAAKRAQPQGYSPPRSAPRDIPPPRTGPIPRHMPEADLSPSPLSDRSLQFRMSLSGEYVSPPSLPWMVQGQGVWSPWKPLLRMRKRKREPSARMPPQDKGEPSTCMPPPDKGETSTRMPPSNNGEPSTRIPQIKENHLLVCRPQIREYRLLVCQPYMRTRENRLQFVCRSYMEEKKKENRLLSMCRPYLREHLAPFPA
ncbi:hypothetical protein F4801DRAFT_259569 [Xylaria longipes]|nr:hypothetical protein F4801DRAFT_259569 [Xylaria longipes]